MKIISMDSVCKFYNTKKILDNITLEIEHAQRVVILGPSGCGKTTMLRLIAGFIASDTGSISIAGELVCKDGQIIKPPEQRNLGMVFQDLALWPHLSVKGNIEFGLKAIACPRHQRQERIKQILKLVHMSDYALRKPSELSGGQQQRVALARSLVLEPDILLMDEPLSSLDKDLRLHMRKEIIRLQKELGFTLLYVTHDQDEAFDIATQVVYMQQGSIHKMLF